jgi:hypothetical protein
MERFNSALEFMKRILGIVIISVAFLAAARAELKVASLSTITTDIARDVGGEGEGYSNHQTGHRSA